MSRRNSDCSVYIGNVDQRVTEELLWELFLQAGPVINVHIPVDKDSGKQKPFAFVEFSTSVSAYYAWELLDGIKLFDRQLNIRPQQKEAASDYCPRNQMHASAFYKDFYNKYEELKRRPQSEPRKRRREEESFHYNHNRSFSPSLNRSFSSPAPPTTTYSPYQQPMWHAVHPMSRMYMGSPVGNLMFNQTPPPHSHHR